MNFAYFRFYEELNDFLPAGKKKTEFTHRFDERQSVKDIIESLGVPHVEVDLILVNSVSVEFSHRLQNGDRVSVYPVFEGIDITGFTRLRAEPLRQVRFILDVHLGKLAKYLRLCGFDTIFSTLYEDRELIDIAANEKRIILTCDRGLLKNKKVTHGYWIRSQKNAEQLRDVIHRFDLKEKISLFTRCLKCNSLTIKVKKEKIIDRLQANTIRYFGDFKICPGCGRIYWNGSHYDNMKKIIEKICSQ